MANQENRIPDISEFDRTINYVQFQLHQVEGMLSKFYGTDAHKSCYAHLVAWKQSLQNELYDLRKSKRK